MDDISRRGGAAKQNQRPYPCPCRSRTYRPVSGQCREGLMARSSRQPAATRFPLIATVLVLLGLVLTNLTIDQTLGLGLIDLTNDQRPGVEIGGVTIPTPLTDQESATEATRLDAV